MTQWNKVSAVVFLCAFAVAIPIAQVMTMKFGTGSQTLDLSALNQIRFKADTLIAEFKTQPALNYSLAAVQSLKFSEEAPVPQTKKSRHQATIKAVLVNHGAVLRVDLSAFPYHSGILNLMNMKGSIITQMAVQSESVATLQVAALPKGLYLCQFKNQDLSTSVLFVKH